MLAIAHFQLAIQYFIEKSYENHSNAISACLKVEYSLLSNNASFHISFKAFRTNSIIDYSPIGLSLRLTISDIEKFHQNLQASDNPLASLPNEIHCKIFAPPKGITTERGKQNFLGASKVILHENFHPTTSGQKPHSAASQGSEEVRPPYAASEVEASPAKDEVFSAGDKIWKDEGVYQKV